MRFFLGMVVGTLIAIAIAAAAVHFAFGDLKGVNLRDGKRDTSKDVARTFDFTGFDSLNVAGIYEVDVTVGGDAYSVSLSGPPAELDRASVRVDGGRLVLDRKDGEKKIEGGWRNRQSVTAKITMPALSAFEASGVVDAEVSGVGAERLTLQLSGVGDLEVKGTCGALTANLSGVGHLDAENLECKSATVSVSGVGDASVNATEKVDASVGGIGSITVYGAPKEVAKSSSLFSSITVK